MTSHSIYHKHCPACGAQLSASAKCCDCGHSFESSGEAAPLPEEQALQEEELFEAYLSARVDQTVAAVEFARTELAADRQNSRKSAELLKTILDALALRDEREAQAEKIARARDVLQAARGGSASTETDFPNPSTHATEAFRNKQTAKAEKIAEAFADTETKKCPHCETVLPVTSALCCCGYIFSSHRFMLPRAVDVSTRGDIYQSEIIPKLDG